MFRWSAAINHVKQHRQLTGGGAGYGGNTMLSTFNNSSTDVSATTLMFLSDESKTQDELSIIMNYYSQRLTKERNGT
jgi:hypothetical protein